MKSHHAHVARLESQLRGSTKEKRDADKKYRALQDELLKTQRALGQALEIRGHTPIVHEIKRSTTTRGGATAIALASDWHVDEIVDQRKVNGLNKYNPDIARERAWRFFDLVLRFIGVDRQESTVDNLILWLGGDFFTSSLMHDATVAMPAVEAAMFAQDLLASGLTFLHTNEPKLKIHLVCSVGNHSRITGSLKPVNVAIEQELSLEYMMYHALKMRFPQFAWTIDNSYHSYVKVYDKILRFNHGHIGWRYNDGLGGVHGPLWKAITQRWDKQIRADLTCCGHYHQSIPAGRSRPYTVNGSLIGPTPYSLSFGNEPPIQNYFMVHGKYGIVAQRPLLVGGSP